MSYLVLHLLLGLLIGTSLIGLWAYVKYGQALARRHISYLWERAHQRYKYEDEQRLSVKFQLVTLVACWPLYVPFSIGIDRAVDISDPERTHRLELENDQMRRELDRRELEIPDGRFQ